MLPFFHRSFFFRTFTNDYANFTQTHPYMYLYLPHHSDSPFSNYHCYYRLFIYRVFGTCCHLAVFSHFSLPHSLSLSLTLVFPCLKLIICFSQKCYAYGDEATLASSHRHIIIWSDFIIIHIIH